ncbi:MAG: 50S ribosomal protein L17 [Chlamydiia bacterium]|nr:50S ribosomal protein L17 [Chlamydiia bacterium]
MRHQKRTVKLNRNASHRRCLFANMLKSLIVNGRIETSVAKGKELRRLADKMVTIGKDDSIANRRRAKAKLMIRHNPLTSKEARAAKAGDKSAYNTDRQVLPELFEVLGRRFAERQGGYTRLVRTGRRVGDNAEMCVLEFLAD